MVFCLLYTPCIAAVATIRKEQGRGAAILMVIFQCIVAWLVAWAVHLIGSILLEKQKNTHRQRPVSFR